MHLLTLENISLCINLLSVLEEHCYECFLSYFLERFPFPKLKKVYYKSVFMALLVNSSS